MSRIVNKELLQDYRGKPCLICRSMNSDPHHIRPVSNFGPDKDWNLIPLCRSHHSEIHQIGLNSFVVKYGTGVAVYLKVKGWEFDEFLQRWIRLTKKDWENEL